jgi:lipopolysaccharide/colanic/teichoic acid biosynthesis glycosyltransferase
MTSAQAAVKRIMDVGGAVTGLVVLAPLLLLIAIVVRLDSRGPALYVDERLGVGGRRFRLLKFRSMHVGSPARYNPDGSMLVAADDPRVTRVGRVLRLGFDELPQLWNVLVGDMSLVGPRPDPAWALGKYDPGEEIRMTVRPGITGLAQVVGRTEIPWRDRLALDVRYVREYSLGLDLKLLALTALEVLPFRHSSRRRNVAGRSGAPKDPAVP